MTTTAHTVRNALGPAHAAAESLYDNACTLTLHLDAWSVAGRSEELTQGVQELITHNLINARTHLDILEATLRPHMAAPTGQPTRQ